MFFLYKKLNWLVKKIHSIWLLNLIKFLFWRTNIIVPWIKKRIFLRAQSSDRDCYYQIFIEEVYKNIPKNATYILDLGANIGMSALYFRKHIPHSKIIAIEPDPINFQQLLKNTQENNIFCLNSGIWYSSTNLKINNENAGSWWSQVKACRESWIQGITVDFIMKEFNFPRIDILKIDIEWSEKYLFEKNYRSWLEKTSFIAIELHDRILDWCSGNFFYALNEIWWKKYQLSIRWDTLFLSKILW